MKSFKKIISTITAVMMLGAMAVMPAQAAEGVRVDPQTFYADTDGIEVKVTDGTLKASDIIITKKSDGSTVTVDAVSTDADGVATISAGVETGVKYVITIGEVTRQFEITAVVDGIDDLTPVVSGWGYNPKGAKIVDDEYFVQAAHLVIDGDAAETVKNLKRYSVSYDYGRYDGGYTWGQRILWNATANGTANSPHPKDGYGFHMSYNALANHGDSTIKNSVLMTVSLDKTADTTVKSTDLYVRETGSGAATLKGTSSDSDPFTVNVTSDPTKYWPIKVKKNGAEGTLFIDGHEIYTYYPDSNAPTTGYFVLIQDHTGFGSISNFLITTSKFAEIKDVTITDLYADADGVEFTSTGSTFTQEDVTLKTKAGETIGITSVTTADGITTVVPATALPADTDYVLTVGEGTKEFRITAVVNGINANTFKAVWSTSSGLVAGVKYDTTTGKYFMDRAAAGLNDTLAETVKKLNRYTVTYDYGMYDNGWNVHHSILWNSSSDSTSWPSDGYGFYIPGDKRNSGVTLNTYNSGVKTPTTLESSEVVISKDSGSGTATKSGQGDTFAVEVTSNPTKYWPIKVKKIGAEGTLFIDGTEIYTYNPGADAPTTGNFVIIQDQAILASISNFMITTTDVIEPAVAPQIVGATRDGATVTFTVKGNTVESAWVGFALYGANNKFLGIASATYTLTTEGESKSLTVSGVNASGIVTAKMFMWDNITNSLKPLCNVVTPTAVN